jgi:hypothetical protein
VYSVVGGGVVVGVVVTMEVPSLRPEVGLELFKLVLLRESYLKRLDKQLHRTGLVMDLSVVGMIDLLRETTIQIVEMTDTWEKTQISFPVVQPFTWNGENYLSKLMHDVDWLDDIPLISAWLGFSMIGNPFLIPPEVLSPYLSLTKDAMIIFGQLTEQERLRKMSVKKVVKPLKSPYTTPIINDPQIFSHLSARSKLDKKFKTTAKGNSKSGVGKQDGLIALEDTEEPNNPYQCYLPVDLIQTIKKCWNKLQCGSFIIPPLADTGTSMGGTSMYDDDETKIGSTQPSMERRHSIGNNDANSAIRGTSIWEQSATQSQLDEEIDHIPSSRAQLNEHTSLAQSKEGFYNSLFSQSERQFKQLESMNESHRLSKFVETHLISDPQSNLTTLQHSKLWTPHEINLQRKVQRRGGELFVLTAAGVKGRLKAPWRRNRFERMEVDVVHLTNLSEQLSMNVEDQRGFALRLESRKPSLKQSLQSEQEFDDKQKSWQEKMKLIQKRLHDQLDAKLDVELRRKFLTEQHRYFQRVAENGSLTELEQQRQRHRLNEGQAREQDQLVSMKLEDAMARKMQGLVRRVFGRSLRRAALARRHRAATTIQCQYRTHRVNQNVLLRTQQVRLAMMLLKAYRMFKAGIFRKQLRLEALQLVSTNTIQRVFRGYLGRRRLGLKRVMVKALSLASEVVSIVNLKPGDVEELANAIEDYTRDYTTQLPLAVLTVLRGVLYIFNGDGAECVIVKTEDGFMEKKYIYAFNSSWQAMKLILRRKGRFLRRLRALIKNSMLPNPSRIRLSKDSINHLHAIKDQLSEEQFHFMKRGKTCVMQLFKYLLCVMQVFDLQTLFPEYFEPGLPFWFRNLMRIREQFDRADIRRRIESKANARIEEVKRMHSREGKKYGHISQVVRRNQKELDESRQHVHSMKNRLRTCIQDLVATEQKEVLTLEAIVRAKSLAKDVASGDLREYMRATLIPDEAYIKELQYNLDTKSITLIEAQTNLIFCKERNERNVTFRDFDKLLKLKVLQEFVAELGKVKADLLILMEAWRQMLVDIGGTQYIKDLVGDQFTKFQVIQDTAIRLLQARKDYEIKVEDELKTQYDKVYAVINQSNMLFVDKKWDLPTIVEVDYEEFENMECCRRDYEAEFRKRRQLESLDLKSPYPWSPMIVFVDIKLPREFIHCITSALEREFSFEHTNWMELVAAAEQQNDKQRTQSCSHSSKIVDDQHGILSVQDYLQEIIDKQSNVLSMINRGFHHMAKLTCDNYIQAVINVLVPKPRVVYISAENCFSTDLWLEQSSIDRNYLFTPHGIAKDQSPYDLLLGKIRKLGSHFHRLLQVFPKMLNSNADKTQPGSVATSTTERQQLKFHGPLPSFLQSQFAMDFHGFIHSIKFHLQQLLKQRTDFRNQVVERKRQQQLSVVKSIPPPPQSRTQTPILQDRKSNEMNQRTGRRGSSRPVSAVPATTSDGSSRPESGNKNSNTTDRKKDVEHTEHTSKRTIDDIDYFESFDPLQGLSKEGWMDFILAMNLSIIWGLFNAPITPWTHEDIFQGVQLFRNYLSTVNIEKLSLKFKEFSVFGSSDVDKLSKVYHNLDDIVFLQAQLRQNLQYNHVWENCRRIDFHKQPARALLTTWLDAILEFVKR